MVVFGSVCQIEASMLKADCFLTSSKFLVVHLTCTKAVEEDEMDDQMFYIKGVKLSVEVWAVKGVEVLSEMCLLKEAEVSH